MSSRTPSPLSSRTGSMTQTPSRVEVVLNGHFVSPSTHQKGTVPIDPALLEMELDPELTSAVTPNGHGEVGGGGSDEDAEGSDEDAEGEAVDEELDLSPWPMTLMPADPAPSFYPPSHLAEAPENEAGPSRLPDLHTVLHGDSNEPLQSLSPRSTTPAHGNKRNRLPRATTSQPPNGTIVAQPHVNGNGNSHSHINGHAPAEISSLKVKIKGNRTSSKSKGKDRAYDGDGAVIADLFCSFCNGSAERNKQGKPESMVSCHLCGRSGHFSCLAMKRSDLIRTVQSYNWTCIECKTCEECALKENEGELMFCDGCDKGWHFACANPPLKRLPKGSWRCHHCRARVANSSSHAGPSSQPYLDPPSQKHKGKGKGKGKSFDGFHPTQFHPLPQHPPPTQKSAQPNKARKSIHSTDVLEDSHSTPKIKPLRRPKHKPGTPGFSPTPDLIPPPRINIRLRIPARYHSAEVEVEEPEEEKVPFGGVIEGADADTTKTTIIEADKVAFERSRRIAEEKLGGPPPGATTTAGGATWESAPGIGSPGSTPGPSRSGSMINLTPAGRQTPQPPSQPAAQHSLSRALRDRLFTQALPSTPDSPAMPSIVALSTTGLGPSQKINKIRFGAFDIDTWYSAPYPEEYQYVPEGRLWLCEFCLKFMKSGFVAGRHRMKCKARHPPGDEIYRDGNVSVFEVDGRKNKIYCQNLCLLAKMFLDHKTLYYDVEPFLFYVMTEVDDLGARFVGYFSKEKRSPDNNVSCIMTLPVRQRKGWGQLLIDFSYLLSKKEGRVGSPEKPLSGLGAVTYKKYWQLSVFAYLRDATGPVSLDDISAATSMTLLDVYTTLRDAEMIRVQPIAIPIRRAIPSRGRARAGRGRGSGSARPRQSLLRNSTSLTDIDDSAADLTTSSTAHAPPNEEAETKIPESGRYEIIFDRDYLDSVLQKHAAKGHLTLRPERLKYHPFLVSRNLPQKVGGNALEVATAAISDIPADEDSGKTAVEAEQVNEDGVEGALEKVVQDGQDPETLALVAALSHEQTPKRNMRKRTSLSEEQVPPATAGGGPGEALTPRVKRVRRSTRASPVVPLARRGRSSAISDPVKGQGPIVIYDDEDEGEVVQPVHVDSTTEAAGGEQEDMIIDEDDKGVEPVEDVNAPDTVNVPDLDQPKGEGSADIADMAEADGEKVEDPQAVSAADQDSSGKAREPILATTDITEEVGREKEQDVVLSTSPAGPSDLAGESGEGSAVATDTAEVSEAGEGQAKDPDAGPATNLDPSWGSGQIAAAVTQGQVPEESEEKKLEDSRVEEAATILESVPAEMAEDLEMKDPTPQPEGDLEPISKPSVPGEGVDGSTQSATEGGGGEVSVIGEDKGKAGDLGSAEEDAEGEDEDAEGEEDEEYVA